MSELRLASSRKYNPRAFCWCRRCWRAIVGLVMTRHCSEQVIARRKPMSPSRQRAHLAALVKSPRAAHLHSPNGLKATVRRANDIAQEVQAENELLMTEAQLLHAIEEVLAAKMLDLEEKHQHLQAAHRQLRLDNESLEAVIEQCKLAITIARRDVHRLEAQLRKYQRRPQLTRKQRQQLQILKQTGVSIEVLRRVRTLLADSPLDPRRPRLLLGLGLVIECIHIRHV
ncbi:hypothetical protein V8C86DRAFT_2446109 [Haematococcus lacustris]